MDDHSELRTAPGTGKGEQHRKLHPPFAQPDPGRRATPHMAAGVSEEPIEEESLPRIEEFVDELPSIEDFLLPAQAPAPTPASAAQASPARAPINAATETETDVEGWADADWQSYDWSGLASLGAPAPEAAEAHAAWSSTNWEAAGTGSRDAFGREIYLREDEVAAALDEIARRIRSGELSLHQFRGSPPEAAIAAAFASLLRNRG
jgi:hypothetical protein